MKTDFIRMHISPFIRFLGYGAAFIVAASSSFSAPPIPAKETTVAIAAGIDLATSGPQTRFSITLSQPVAAAARLMERPDRVVIDLPEVTFHLPAETGFKREGVVASFRYGLFAPGRSRVVIDLAQPALVTKIEVRTIAPGNAAILTVELTKTDRETFRKTASETPLETISSMPAPLEEVAPRDNRPVIMLDPGHGGVDPGAASIAGTFEKEIVLAFAESLKKKLDGDGRYRVLMTRDRDVFIPLAERVHLAQKAKADLFVSIHADSIAGAAQEVRGLTIYTGSERASDAESARLADRENRADQAAGSETGEHSDEDVSDILKDLMLRETRAYSHSFASRLTSELDSVARFSKNPHRQAGFRVLRAPDVPSVLVELGYLSSRKDFDLLVSEEWRDKTTAAMSAAVDRFFASRLSQQGRAPVSP